MKAVFLDADTFNDVDMTPIHDCVSELVLYPTTSPEELGPRAAGADLLITNKVNISADVMTGKRGILVVATGLNNVDLETAQQLGVPVLNVQNYGTASVAQHTMMLMLSLAGQLPRYQQDVAQGAWQQSPFFCLMNHPTRELTNKRLILVGEGTLGSAVARLAEAFGMQVEFAARPGKANDTRPSLDSLLPTADVLSFHCPLTEHTRHLLNADNLTRIKPDCLVVNCARGGIIDEVAALDALQQGQLGGLAVDVLPTEPPVDGHPLLEALNTGLNLMVTPHNAWISPEARQNIINLTAANIRQLNATDQTPSA
ncbi:D-2-hydroxyacid dehydrogenase [Oceanobacter sp. 5_MG-2023]|uniref:D-2-hydroxyacid dehydrogenase n=1 Tax=Oceanobacter sp. 5_MG-2023 TaxID=3062645 RepID=UPI0026E3A5A5|nr:D-2-hydroxyacid dehydrogenase [Oceanobacter sp. 5_MG-2023]MDO6681684.1 D-2-hydroxyacid dehydrogenase [Oceanobacter sp. 5_MG-2023]